MPHRNSRSRAEALEGDLRELIPQESGGRGGGVP